MNQVGMARPGRKMLSDHILIATVIALVGIGLVTLFSASDAYSKMLASLAEGSGGRTLTFFEEQLLNSLAGVFCFVIAALLPIRFVRALVPWAVALAVLLCLLTFVPGIRDVKNGAARWIRIGPFGYQPSELVKLVLPLYLAHIFDKKQKDLDSFVRGILPPVLVLVLFFLLICLQNNFSTALFIVINGLLVFWLAGVKVWYFIASPVILFIVSVLTVFTRPHGLARLMSFFWPNRDPQGADYQVNASILSIASGSIWGKGLGRGTRKISSVPEIHSDFIFSAYAEELGFAGVLLFFVVFLVFAFRGYRAALRCEDTFRRLLGLSFVTIIISQALINVAVVAGALPVTGMPLPFFSHGGSSLVTCFIMSGLIINISRTGERSRAAGYHREAFRVF
jgi:cell division protein FtsW